MEFIPYEFHKHANNKIPKNAIQSFSELCTLVPGNLTWVFNKLRESQEQEAGGCNNKLRNYQANQSQIDFFVARHCRTFDMLIINLQRAVQWVLLIIVIQGALV